MYKKRFAIKTDTHARAKTVEKAVVQRELMENTAEKYSMSSSTSYIDLKLFHLIYDVKKKKNNS